MSNEVSSNYPATVQKQAIRQRILTARTQKTMAERLRDDEKLSFVIARWLEKSISSIRSKNSQLTVAAFIPVGDEPGASLGKQFLLDLQKSIGDGALLLPICPPGPPAALNWGVFNGELTTGKYGLLEPDCNNSGNTLPPSAIADADIILLPGVAGDARTGMRMGRGAGYYDRSLALIQNNRPITALVLHPDEIIDSVPHDPHDEAVDIILTATGEHTPSEK